MTLRKTEIIEWSTTPAELRRIAEAMELENNAWDIVDNVVVRGNDIQLHIAFDLGQWQAEQAEVEE